MLDVYASSTPILLSAAIRPSLFASVSQGHGMFFCLLMKNPTTHQHQATSIHILFVANQIYGIRKSYMVTCCLLFYNIGFSVVLWLGEKKTRFHFTDSITFHRNPSRNHWTLCTLELKWCVGGSMLHDTLHLLWFVKTLDLHRWATLSSSLIFYHSPLINNQQICP